MALVVWAASFGVNEYGVEEQESPANIRQHKEHVNDMLQELLYLIDLHGILRKATWDGVRLLLLLLPLTQGMIAFSGLPSLPHQSSSRNSKSSGAFGEMNLPIVSSYASRFARNQGDVRGYPQPDLQPLQP